MNTQPISKRDFDPEGKLWVHSIFYTIQGEGPFAGTPAVFVRLQGCNLQCPGCDTEYTQGAKLSTVENILWDVFARHDVVGVKRVKPLVVITGGEPFRQNIANLIYELRKSDYSVQIETNGTLPSPQILYSKDISQRSGVYLVCSPKTPKIHPSIAKVACAFKYVLSHDSFALDGLPVEVLHNKVPTKVYRPTEYPRTPIYVQPMDHGIAEINAKSLEAAKTSCLKYGYIFQLQIHKIIGVQ